MAIKKTYHIHGSFCRAEVSSSMSNAPTNGFPRISCASIPTIVYWNCWLSIWVLPYGSIFILETNHHVAIFLFSGSHNFYHGVWITKYLPITREFCPWINRGKTSHGPWTTELEQWSSAWWSSWPAPLQTWSKELSKWGPFRGNKRVPIHLGRDFPRVHAEWVQIWFITQHVFVPLCPPSRRVMGYLENLEKWPPYSLPTTSILLHPFRQFYLWI